MRLGLLHEGTMALTWEVGDAAVRVGRAATNDLVLPHADVSGHHAVLHVADGSLWITDLRSANGTWAGEERVVGTVALAPGSRIRLGAHATLVVLDSAMEGGDLLLARVDGLAAWPVRAGGIAVPGTSADLLVDASGLWLASEHADDRPVQVGEPFEVEGQAFVVRPAGELATTQRLVVPTHPELAADLDLHVDQAAWRAVLQTRDARCVYDADHRVSLLHTLGTRWLQDGAEGGWVSDAELTVSIWGRKHRDHLPNNLHVLVHRVRKDAAAAGLHRGFLQKRAGRTRLKVGRVVLR